MTAVPRLGARPLTTVGVALLGAGAIAVSPIAPPMPTALRIASPDVALTQLPSWITEGAANLAEQIGDIGGLLGSEIANPLPILNTVLHNQILNALGLGTALVGSGTALAQGVVLAPVSVANAIVEAIEDPTQIPAILAELSDTFIALAAGVVTPIVGTVTDIVTTTVDNAVGVFTAVVANAVPILNSFVNIPVAIGTQLLASGSAVIAALATLNPLTVINAIGQGLVDLEETTFDAFAGVVNAFGDLRGDILDVLSPPVATPLAASVAAPAGQATLRTFAAAGTVQAAPVAEVEAAAAAEAAEAVAAQAGGSAVVQEPDRPAPPVTTPSGPETTPGQVAREATSDLKDAAAADVRGGELAGIARGIGAAVKAAAPGSAAAERPSTGAPQDSADDTAGGGGKAGGAAKSHRGGGR